MKPEFSNKIEQLYLEMYDMLFTYASNTFQEESLAEEAVQETFHTACRKAERLCSSQNPKGWLVQTLKFTIQNMRRSRENARQLLSDYLVDQQEKWAASEDNLDLLLLYEDLSRSEEFRLVKELAINGRSLPEMAQDRGISVSACKKRVQRAKEVLRKKMNRDTL